MDEISDSTEVYESKPNKLLPITIYLILGILIAALIWAYFFKIDITVKTIGRVQVSENISIITNEYGGEIKTLSVQDGQAVKEGDVLYVVDTREQEEELEENQKKRSDAEDKQVVLEAYMKALDDEEGEFEKIEDNQYYSVYKARWDLLEVNSKDVTLSADNNKKQINQSIKSSNNMIDYYNTRISNIERAQDCVNDSTNYLNLNNSYYYIIESYLSQYSSTEKQYDGQIGTLNSSGAAKADINKVKQEKKTALESLKTSMLSDLGQQLESARANQLSVKNDKESARTQLDEVGEITTSNSTENLRLSELNNIYNEAEANETEIQELESAIRSLENSIEKAAVTASQSGMVNYKADLVEGNYLTEGEEALSIIPQTESEYEIEAYVSSRDIGKVKEGMDVKCELASFSSSEYGMLEGKVLELSKDVKGTSDTAGAYYIARISVTDDGSYYDNTAADVMQGMDCTVRFIVEEKRCLMYLLEKIELLD